MSYRLVFDYDGVLMRNKYALNSVSNRVTEYVSHKMNVTQSEARRINKIQYKIHGHTVKYLQQEGFDVSIDDFNDFVYGGLDYDDIREHIECSDILRWVDLTNLNTSQRKKSILFTNAPEIWVEKTLDFMGGKPEMFFDSMYYADSIYELKPNPVTYHVIETEYPDDKLLFIDDSIMNISNLSDRWSTKCFDEDDSIYEVGSNLIQTETNYYI